MASIINYIHDSLGDFVLLAHDSPLQAILAVLLIASLAFSNIWGGWIARVQQSAALKVTNVDDAAQGPTCGGVIKSPLRSAPDVQPSGYNLGNENMQPGQGSTGFSSTASNASNPAQQVQRGSIGLQKSPAHLLSVVTSGNNVVGLPLQTRGSVTFYPSTSPRNRGTLSPISNEAGQLNVNEVLPLRQNDIQAQLNRDESLTVSTPSENSQDAVDAQLLDDQARVHSVQIRAEEAQISARMHRENERLRIDIQRVDAHYRAQLRRVEREMLEVDEDIQNVNWNLS